MRYLFFVTLACSMIINFLSFSPLTGAILDDKFNLEELKGKKLGFYVGSFDPIHLGHQHVIESCLKEGYVDYVLVYPAYGGDHYKNRTEHSFRLELIASVYHDHPSVLLTDWTPKELQDHFSKVVKEVEVLGIIGSDVVKERLLGPISKKCLSVFMRGIPLTEKHYKDTICGLMALKAEAFVVALRGNVDFSYLEGRIKDRPVKAFIPSFAISSTEVKKAIRENEPFEQFLAFPVQALIKERGLYGYNSCLDQDLKEELLEMEKRDAAARLKVSSNGESEDFWSEIRAIDQSHRKKLREIVGEYGWPGVSLVGLDGANSFWLLVQHQDEALEFQEECLELLNASIERSEAPIKHFAYLSDRINMNNSRSQQYGTQWVQKEGKYTLYLTEDSENLNARRASVGLGTIEEYKQLLKEAYQLTDEDFLP